MKLNFSKKGTGFVLTIMVSFIFFFSLVSSANIGTSNSNYGASIVIPSPVVIINYSLVNTNSSLYLQGYTPSTLPISTPTSVELNERLMLNTSNNPLTNGLVIQGNITLESSGGSELARLKSDEGYNIFFGLNAGKDLVYTGSEIGNIFIGENSGQQYQGGTANIGVGRNTLYNINTGASSNVCMGDSACSQLNGTASQNTAIGNSALAQSTDCQFQTAVGSNTLSNAVGCGVNQAFGADAGAGLTTGSFNTIGGYDSLAYTTSASKNSVWGMQCLYQSNGNDNVAMGYTAGVNVQDASQSVIIGSEACKGTIGEAYSDNVCIGFRTGTDMTTGSRNILIGSGTNIPSGTENDYLNIGGWLYGSNTRGYNLTSNLTAPYLIGDGSLLTNLPNQYNNPFDQDLNTTSNVTHNNFTATDLYASFGIFDKAWVGNLWGNSLTEIHDTTTKLTISAQEGEGWLDLADNQTGQMCNILLEENGAGAGISTITFQNSYPKFPNIYVDDTLLHPNNPDLAFKWYNGGAGNNFIGLTARYTSQDPPYDFRVRDSGSVVTQEGMGANETILNDGQGNMSIGGQINSYKATATQGMGVAPIYDYVVLKNQTATISATNFTTCGFEEGLYRISFYGMTTYANATAGIIRPEILYDDDTSINTGQVNRVYATLGLATYGRQALTQINSNTAVIQSIGNGIAYRTTLTSGIMEDAQYTLYATCERLA